MLKKVSLTMLVLAVLVPNAPSFAQNEITNNQPVRGSMGKNETRIQAKLKAEYKKGLIDADQLAQFQRDFDGILDKENAIQSDGMNSTGKKDVLKELSAFESRLDKQANLNKANNTATTKTTTKTKNQ